MRGMLGLLAAVLLLLAIFATVMLTPLSDRQQVALVGASVLVGVGVVVWPLRSRRSTRRPD
jgi:hypothetical protein